jgi:hypothetical protein
MPYEEAKEWMLKALEPMGEEYLNIFKSSKPSNSLRNSVYLCSNGKYLCTVFTRLSYRVIIIFQKMYMTI